MTAEIAHKNAHLAIQTYMAQAHRVIDEEFGEGFAEKNPALVGAFVQAASSYVSSAAIAESLSEVAQTLDALADRLPSAD